MKPLIVLLFSIPDYISYPVLSLPIVFAIITWVMNIRKIRSGKADGLIFNGDAWVKWALLLFLGVMLLQFLAMLFPESWGVHKLSLFDRGNKVAALVIGVTLLYFLCYFFIAFRPATKDEIDAAKGAKQLAIDFVSDAAGAAAGAASAAGAAAGGALSLISSLLYPVVTIAGQSFTYLGVGAASFFGSLALLIPVVVILAVLGGLVVLVVNFLTFAVMCFAGIIKFVTNLRYHF